MLQPEQYVRVVSYLAMSTHRERLGLGYRSRLAGGTIPVAVKAAAAAAITLAVCLAAAGCSAISHAARQAASAAPSGTSGALQLLKNAPDATDLASSAATAVPPNPVGPPADPFTGTPADHWADGAAGIVLPAAKPIRGFTAAQVEFAYQWTRKMLIAADLDKKTLLGGAPTAFADLLTNSNRTWFLGGLNKTGRDKTTGAPLSTRGYVVSFAPGSTQLIGSVIKVNGSMRAQAATDDGAKVLDVHVDYLFVYAVEPPHHPEEWMRIVSEAAWILSFGNWQGAATSFEPWFSTTSSAGVAGASCGSTDGYVHPDWPSVRAQASASASSSGKPINPYVPGQSKSGCENTTGT